MTSEVPVRITWAERLVSGESSTPEQHFGTRTVDGNDLELARGRRAHDPDGVRAAQAPCPLCDQGQQIVHVRTREQPLGDLVDRMEPIDGPPALTSVADEGGRIVRPAYLDGGETHLDRELGSVAVPAGKFETHAHLSGAGRLEELTKVLAWFARRPAGMSDSIGSPISSSG